MPHIAGHNSCVTVCPHPGVWTRAEHCRPDSWSVHGADVERADQERVVVLAVVVVGMLHGWLTTSVMTSLILVTSSMTYTRLESVAMFSISALFTPLPTPTAIRVFPIEVNLFVSFTAEGTSAGAEEVTVTMICLAWGRKPWNGR